MTKSYSELLKEEQFQYLVDNLSITNRAPEYYVNWEKVEREIKEFEIQLNTLEYLIGKQNIKEEAEFLFSQQPNLLTAIPQLLAIREQKFPVLIKEDDDIQFWNLDFQNPDINRLSDYIRFMDESGLLVLFKDGIKKSLIDYTTGVEVGLDSNGRKNRSGTFMEQLVEEKIEKICEANHWEYIEQATQIRVENLWGIHIPTDKQRRRFDFAIRNPKTNRIVLIEVNYYGGGGSKLKSVSGEFTDLYNYLRKEDDTVTFMWITDGMGWHTAKTALFEAFEQIGSVYTLKLIEEGYLEEDLKRNL